MMMLPFAFLLLGSWISSWNGIPAFIPPRLARPPFLRSLYAFRNHSNGNDQQNFCFAVRQVPGDGSCLFHSLSAWISFIASNEHVDFDTRVYHLSNKLRQLAVDVLQQQNCTLHLEDGEKMSSEQMLQSASEYYGMSPHEYCETMRCSKTWGGGPEIVALSHHFQCPIFVYELSTEGYFPFKKFCVKMYARYGFPVFRNKPPIHLLNADGRFPHIYPGFQKSVGDHFLALFPCAKTGKILSPIDQINKFCSNNPRSCLDFLRCPKVIDDFHLGSLLLHGDEDEVSRGLESCCCPYKSTCSLPMNMASSSSSKTPSRSVTSLAFNNVQNNLFALSSNAQKSTSKESSSNNPIIEAQKRSKLYDTKTFSAKDEKVVTMNENSLGKGWFGLQTITMNESLKRDLQVIQMRNYMDPKRFYKNPDKPGPIVGVGTVVEGNLEYKSSRLSNKERKQNITEEILADSSIKSYSKRVFMDIQAKKNNKRKVFKASKKEQKKSKKFHAYF